jgi:hypothetical protein
VIYRRIHAKRGAKAVEQRHAYLDGVGKTLRDKRHRPSFAMYAMGLLSDGKRKGVEPIAAPAYADPERTHAVHEQLIRFLGDSPWKDVPVRQYAPSTRLRRCRSKVRFARGSSTTWGLSNRVRIRLGCNVTPSGVTKRVSTREARARRPTVSSASAWCWRPSTRMKRLISVCIFRSRGSVTERVADARTSQTTSTTSPCGLWRFRCLKARFGQSCPRAWCLRTRTTAPRQCFATGYTCSVSITPSECKAPSSCA